MNGGIYTAGPLYRPDPGAPLRDYRPPEMPPRYQPREMQREQVGLHPTPEPVADGRADQGCAPTITPQQRERAVKATAPAARVKAKPKDRGAVGSTLPPSLTQRIIKRIKAKQGWMSVAQLIALAPERLDSKGVANLLHRYRSTGQIVQRRSEDGTQLEYCWGPFSRADEQRAAASGRSISPGSLTFWITGTLRADRERWMSTHELAAAIAIAATTLDAPTPAVISTRLSPLLRSGRLEKRPREGAKHGHGSTMEYRLTTAF